MAEDTSTASAPAGEPAAAEQRAPNAETRPAAAAERAPETNQEKETEKANEPEKEKPSDKDAEEEKEESAEAPAQQPSAPAEATDAKEQPQESGDAAAATPAKPDAAVQPEANGTPASTKKSGGSAKRKSTGGVPEHKGKQNRRKSAVVQVHAKPGEYYLARLRSFPPWPSIVCDEEMLPASLLETRPVSAYRADGTIRDDYSENGKRGHERTYPVMFLQTNELWVPLIQCSKSQTNTTNSAWIPNTCLTPTDAEYCKNVTEKGKSKQLLLAYAVAAEGHDLEHFKSLLSDHQRAMQQEIEEQEAKAAAKAEKEAKKNKRKSMEIADDAEDVEMEDADDAKKPKSSKKRKKDAPEEEADKPAKTPKTGTKLKLTTPKTPASEGGKKASASKSKQAGGKKGTKAASDEDEDTGAESKEPEKPVNPEEVKAKKEKEVLYIRHKLQKGFISRDAPPKEEEMNHMSGYFGKLEGYKELEVAIIRKTKINKVLKMIVKLSSIPRDEEFQFRQRAIDLLSRWKNDLEPESAAALAADEKDEKPKANGVHDGLDTPEKEKEGGETKKDKEDINEPLDEPMPDAEAEKAKEGEKPKEEALKERDVTEEKKAERSEEKPEEKTEKTGEKKDEKAEEKTDKAPEPAPEKTQAPEQEQQPAETGRKPEESKTESTEEKEKPAEAAA